MTTFVPIHLRVGSAPLNALSTASHQDALQESQPQTTHASYKNETAKVDQAKNRQPTIQERRRSAVLATIGCGVGLNSSSVTPKRHTQPKSNTQPTTPILPRDSIANSIANDNSLQRTPGLITDKSTIQSSPAEPLHQIRAFEARYSVPANDSLDSGASSSEESIAQNNQNGRLDKSRRQKLPSGWLTKEEKKALRAQCGLDDPGNSNTITYNDGGWGDQHRFDWNAPNQLVDWEGNMLPAPVEWGGRRQYRPDNLVEFIVKYIHDSQPFYVEKNGVFSSNQVIDVSHDSFRGEENSEIAPKSWITEKIENQTLQSFWESLPHIVPEPVDSDDVQGKPFWLRYQHSSAFLQPLEHLTALCEPVSDQGPSAGRNALRLWIRSKRQTADTATQEYRDKENNNAKEERRQRRIEKRIRRDQLNAPKIAPPPNPHRPKVNIYLRPINISTDVKGVLDIYKHYANETAYVSELDAPDLRAMTQRFHDIEGTALPVIVAIGRLGEGKKDHQANGYASSEKIVGFAYADEDEGRHTQMSYTADVEIYVHKDYQTKGIGQNLLDRMMYLLDPLHSCVSDVLWRPPEDEPHWTCPGGKRIVGTVRVVFYYGTDERARCMWIREWLKRFGFKMEADMSRAGVKLGKWTRQAIFQKETGHMIEPASVVRTRF